MALQDTLNSVVAEVQKLGTEVETEVEGLANALLSVLQGAGAAAELSKLVGAVTTFLQDQANNPVYNIYPDNIDNE